MNVLILLEQDKYLPLANIIAANPQISGEVTNMDFNLTASINKSQVVIFFGDNSQFMQFANQYDDILVSKLIIKTCVASLESSNIEVSMHISNGVGICAVPSQDEAICFVIIETIQKIFDQCLKLMMCDPNDFQTSVSLIGKFEQELQKLSDNYCESLGKPVIEQVLKNISVN